MPERVRNGRMAVGASLAGTLWCGTRPRSRPGRVVEPAASVKRAPPCVCSWGDRRRVSRDGTVGPLSHDSVDETGAPFCRRVAVVQTARRSERQGPKPMFDLIERVTSAVTSPFFFAFMIGAMAALFPLSYTQSALMAQRRVRRGREELRTSVLGKLGAKFDLTAADLDRFCNAHGVDKTSAKRVLDRIYAGSPPEIEVEVVDRLRPLLEEVEANQPYDHLPIEVRPSLVRIDSLVAKSSDHQDRAVLGPILAALNEYVGFAAERKRLSVHKNVAYAIGVVSLVIGGATLYLTPSEEQLARSVASELTEVLPAALEGAAEGG